MTAAAPLYLSKIQLKAELDRCLNCKTMPCMNACPVNCNPQEFINHAKQGNYDAAVKTICRSNPMGQTCGLICPDKFCMRACTRSKIDFAVRIPKVQATILENYRTCPPEQTQPRLNGLKIAVVGAGPAGIAAADILSKQGCQVVIFEKSPQIGGALNLIPDNRLPHHVIEKDWNHLPHRSLITLRLNTPAPDPQKLLRQDFDGVIMAGGEPNCRQLRIPGEELCLSYTDYLRNPDRYKTTGKVAVIGGGNVAADCAFTAKANGSAHVEMFVRRRLADMRISKQEYLELISREINVTPLSSPEKIESDDSLLTLFLHKNDWGDNKLTKIPDSTVRLPGFALVIKAVGSYADPQCDNERVVYAGDCKTGGSTIVEVLASGQTAAETLLASIKSGKSAACG